MRTIRRFVVPLVGTAVMVFAAVLAGGMACNSSPPPDVASPTAPVATTPVASEPELPNGVRVHFADVARAAGIRFLHQDGATPNHYVPEIMGGGVAWLDYDQDGYLDVLFIQGGPFPPNPKAMPQEPTSRLYRNKGDGTFEDVTAKVGLLHPGYGQGVAAGDYDNDGFPDLYITCFGHGHLFHNEPDGKGGRRFRDVTKESGVAVEGWVTSCAFGDLHGKGFLDLFVCRYVQMDVKNYPYCGDKTKDPPVRFTCGPREFRGTMSYLFRNNGNGTFTNVSKEAGLEVEGKGLGVLILDLNGDGKPDLFVGNDEMPNHHYENKGSGKLQSCGVLSGTAATWQGRPMGSMGVEADDLTGSGRPDIFITTYYHEGTTLFRNNDKNFFTDISQMAGMLSASWDRVGWGTCLIDVDHDSALDIMVVNGHVYRNATDVQAKAEDGKTHAFAMLPQLFRGNGRGSFREISQLAGPYFQEEHVGRGLAMGDFDNDGRMDVGVNHVNGPAALLHNESETPNHWVRLCLEGSRHANPAGSNRDAIGAQVTLTAGGRKIVRHVKGGGSYYSCHERRLLIGLGTATKVDEVEVRWPNAAATVQKFGPLEAGKSYKLIEGASAAVPANCPPLKK